MVFVIYEACFLESYLINYFESRYYILGMSLSLSWKWTIYKYALNKIKSLEVQNSSWYVLQYTEWNYFGSN
jgi:hypothetical protein